ncbi:thermonuclease family protein [Limibaculum sp. FT325]|uniref:thermonuclease family protein n=1 Tax=Thermohalobaculum sediminis TaxID=2939436 RepID=UPI0020BF5F18|nr:thermonuclease family protein [Limibaculum sediminis]MCL5776442.1 thermonuclease family protein [Limibaculum sediminis]
MRAATFIFLISVPCIAVASDLRGVPRVIDGDTLALGDVRIRLHALHAPEMDEPRGREAKAALAAIVGRKPITCRAVDRDRYGRIVADCQNADGRDLARAMIEAGAARHCPRYGRRDLAELPDNGLKLPGYCQ